MAAPDPESRTPASTEALRFNRVRMEAGRQRHGTDLAWGNRERARRKAGSFPPFSDRASVERNGLRQQGRASGLAGEATL
jgi:hypothetical protein